MKEKANKALRLKDAVQAVGETLDGPLAVLSGLLAFSLVSRSEIAEIIAVVLSMVGVARAAALAIQILSARRIKSLGYSEVELERENLAL